jgi:ABC-type multidrug transport system ATPase subunit
MNITLTNLGKRYNRDWIFRHLDYTFSGGKKYAITGPNGSGKSTLLQIVAGAVSHNEGAIGYTINNQSTSSEDIHQQLSLAAPYMELIEEMTAKELLEFHSTFKSLRLPIDEIIAIVGLSKATNKQIRYYSSGMKQRLKLAQAFFSETPILCLDEPTTNLDAAGIALYDQLIDQYTNSRMVLISSNDEQEYKCCDEVIKMEDFKKT